MKNYKASIEMLQGESASIESRDAWYILQRAHLHLSQHGNAYSSTIALDAGDRKAQVELAFCRKIIRAEEDYRNALSQGTAAGAAHQS